MTVTIRSEHAGDIYQIHEVTACAFSQSELGHHGEADVIERLRNSSSEFVSLVAEVEGRVVGHILFTPVVIECGAERVEGMGLAPMSVSPDFQNRGIGTRLVQAGLDQLRLTQCPFVVVLGHAKFYQRLGFVPASKLGISCEFSGIPDEVFRIVFLDNNTQSSVSGVAKYRPEFST